MKKHSLLKTAALTAGAYTLGLHGRTGHPDLELLRKYRFAHRGYHDKPLVPENSLPAFRRAIAHGWGAELDVHLMKDGTLAVIHDSSLLRTAGADVQIEELTREGYIYKIQGKGTFVKERTPQKQNFSVITSCSTLIRSQDMTPSKKILFEGLVPCSAEIAQRLGLAEGDPVLEYTRVYFANGTPVI